MRAVQRVGAWGCWGLGRAEKLSQGSDSSLLEGSVYPELQRLLVCLMVKDPKPLVCLMVKDPKP